MSAINNMKDFIKKMYLDAAKTKEDVDNAAKLSNLADEVEKENASLVEKNATLLNAYKEVVADATGTRDEAPDATTEESEAPSLDSIFDKSLEEWDNSHPE